MSWWGKLAGGAFGFMLAGPLGAVLGAAIGHNFDKGFDHVTQSQAYPRGHRLRVQTAFFTATFSVMGHICKADGQVSKDEIQTATHVMAEMDLSAQQRDAAKALFNEGKKADFDLSAVLLQFKQEIGKRSTLRRMFIEILSFAAYADGLLHPAERKLLGHVCDVIGFSRFELESILTSVSAELHHRRQAGGTGKITLEDAYAVLNVGKEAGDAEVKKAYRRLISQHHPDKLVAKGLPEEMMKMASQRTHEIRQAYERIKDHRGF